MLSISEALVKYNLFHYFELWYDNSTFPSYQNWEKIVRDKILAFESETWSQICEAHPDILDRTVLKICHLWSLADEYPDLVIRMDTQVRLMGNFGTMDSFRG